MRSMGKNGSGHWVLNLVVGVLLALAATTTAWAGEEPGGGKSPIDKAAATSSAAKPLTGRLPIYYGELVDDQQRQAIYAIQNQYAERIKRIGDELAAATQERNEKVHAVLNPEQQRQLAEKMAEAKQKRTARKSQSSAAAGKKRVAEKTAAGAN